VQLSVLLADSILDYFLAPADPQQVLIALLLRAASPVGAFTPVVSPIYRKVAQRLADRPTIDRSAFHSGGNDKYQLHTGANQVPGPMWWSMLSVTVPAALAYVDKPHVLFSGIQLAFLSVAMDYTTMAVGGAEFLK
jgi:hypothetical protein